MNEYVHNGIRIFYNTENGFRYNMNTSHFHSEYEIYYLTSGTRHLYINDNKYHMTSGAIALIDGENMHRAFSPDNEPYTRFIVCIDKHLMQEYYPSLVEPFAKGTVFSLNGKQQAQMNLLVSILIRELEHDLRMRHEAIHSLVTNLLINASRFSDEQTAAVNNINSTTVKVLDYINNHYNEKLSLSLIAQSCYISVSHLTRLFKASTGYTVTAYINSLRIKKASEMIKNTTMPISEIASQTGYESLSYFVKLFSEAFGVSPLKYRKSNTSN